MKVGDFMPKITHLNNDWLFQGSEVIRIPHTVKETPLNYFDEKIYQGIFTYEKFFSYDLEYDNRVFLCFDGVAHKAEIFINNNHVLTHLGGYDSFEVEITKYLQEENHLKVLVDSNESLNIPPFGKVIDYMTYGGIYREVYLKEVGKDYIEDIFVKPIKDKDWFISLDVKTTKELETRIEIFDGAKMLYQEYTYLPLKDKKIKIDNPILWDLDNPHLYTLKITIPDDEYYQKFGLRTAIFKNDGFYLNDKKIKIVGLNRHQSYPYVGYAMPKSMQKYDVDILKNELGVNAVRTSHYMQSKHFLDRCDELGIMVFTETPGWQHLGDDNWKDLVLENIKAMVKMNKNHPSVILYGARINESVDDHDLYTKTNNLLKELDNTRQRGGVRCYPKGEELEDVYTYNDFLNPNEKRGLSKKKDIVKSKDMPYLVSEFNGHMYPTKMFDDSFHHEEHLRRLSKGLNELHKDDEINGLFIWCMFDYNTHKEFGSGDRICYHGVMDMFRNPKPASYILASQQNKIPFMESSNLNVRGDYPACSIEPISIYTNLDKIKLYKNGVFIKEFGRNDTDYKYIPNPPILVDDFLGNQLEENEGYSHKVSENMKEILQAFLKYGAKMPLKYLLKYLNLALFHHINFQKGYELYGKYFGGWGSIETIYKIEGIKDDKVVKTLTLRDAEKLHLEVKVSNTNLVDEDTYDVASIRIMAIDANGNRAFYCNQPIEIINDDLLDVIGPKLISFNGGASGTYVKTKRKKGVSTLTIKTPFASLDIKFNIDVKD